MMTFRDPRFVVAYTIIVGFAVAYIHNPSDTMNGALIAAFAGAWGYYLGSSSGTTTIRDQVGKALDLATNLSPTPAKPDVILDPGQTAQAKEPDA